MLVLKVGGAIPTRGHLHRRGACTCILMYAYGDRAKAKGKIIEGRRAGMLAGFRMALCTKCTQIITLDYGQYKRYTLTHRPTLVQFEQVCLASVTSGAPPRRQAVSRYRRNTSISAAQPHGDQVRGMIGREGGKRQRGTGAWEGLLTVWIWMREGEGPGSERDKGFGRHR